MAEFKKLSEVEQIETASDNATVLIEEGGEIKRVPKKEVGGAGIPTVIIKDSWYDMAIAEISTMGTTGPALTYECLNMTFEEAYDTMAKGEPLMFLGMLADISPMQIYGCGMFLNTGMMYEAMSAPIPVIVIVFSMMDYGITLFWTADGLSNEFPGGGGAE